MAYKVNGTTVVDNSRNVCACCVTSCCITASTRLDAPSGNTASRPASPVTGSLYFDTDEGSLVSYNGTDWAAVGGAAVAQYSIASDPYCNCSFRVSGMCQNCVDLGGKFYYPSAYHRMFSPSMGLIGSNCRCRATVLGGDGSFTYSMIYKSMLCVNGLCPSRYWCGCAVHYGVSHTFFGKDGSKYYLTDNAKMPLGAICYSTGCYMGSYECDATYVGAGVCSNPSFNAALVSVGGHTATGGYLSLGCNAILGQISSLIPYDSMRSSLCPAYCLEPAVGIVLNGLLETANLGSYNSCGFSEENKRNNIFAMNYGIGSYLRCYKTGIVDAACDCIYCTSQTAVFGDPTDLSLWTYDTSGAVGVYKADNNSSLKFATFHSKCAINCVPSYSCCNTYVYNTNAGVAFIRYHMNIGGCWCWGPSCCVYAGSTQIQYIYKIDLNTNCIQHYIPYGNQLATNYVNQTSCFWSLLGLFEECFGGGAVWFDGPSCQYINRVHSANHGCSGPGLGHRVHFTRYDHTTMQPICSMELFNTVCLNVVPNICCCMRHKQMIAFDETTCKMLLKYVRGPNDCCGVIAGLGFAIYQLDPTNCALCFVTAAEIPCYKGGCSGMTHGKGMYNMCYNIIGCQYQETRSGLFANNNGDILLVHINSNANYTYQAGKIAKSDWTAVTSTEQFAQILPCGATYCAANFCLFRCDVTSFVCFNCTYLDTTCYLPCYCLSQSGIDSVCVLGPYSCFYSCLIVNPTTCFGAGGDCLTCSLSISDYGLTTGWALCWRDRASLISCCTSGTTPTSAQVNFTCP